jgi:hypothetical protein
MLVTQIKFSIVGILAGERKKHLQNNSKCLKLFDVSNPDSRDAVLLEKRDVPRRDGIFDRPSKTKKPS